VDARWAASHLSKSKRIADSGCGGKRRRQNIVDGTSDYRLIRLHSRPDGDTLVFMRSTQETSFDI
jgi:hypothetical protein